MSYENARFSARLSLNYHDEYIEEVASDPREDVYIGEHVQLDFNGELRVGPHYTLLLEVINLDDEPFRRYIGTPDRPIQEEYYSWWALLSFRADW